MSNKSGNGSLFLEILPKLVCFSIIIFFLLLLDGNFL